MIVLLNLIPLNRVLSFRQQYVVVYWYPSDEYLVVFFPSIIIVKDNIIQ